ncbi:helix-turn-helix domain-containing protein [Halobacillus ihumii]|uniref:helix-turn-helix domain-containing protein n=1 Tax=Halobacillus ihumii TaxID=2686092 RepID=UPI0013D31E68|nr:helix-turn-helix transcriptional regulator [Halobacillus ihumii]
MENRRGAYNHDYNLDERYLRQVRLLRNLTLKDMAKYMEMNDTIISRLENGQIDFTPYYHDRLKQACKKLKVTNDELLACRNIIQQREKRGYK